MSARFLSTPSRRGRHHRQSADLQFEVFLSTPSRRGRPYPGLVLHRTYGVSIHALAKRATGDVYQLIGAMPVSIHALAKRATSHRSRKRLMAAFLSTPSRRGRHVTDGDDQNLLKFLSTPSRRGRQKLIELRDDHSWFLSTPSRRGRPASVTTSSASPRFYPRPREEGDSPTWPRPRSNATSFYPRPREEGDRISP